MTHTDHRGFLFMEGSLMVLIAGVGILSAALFPAMTAYLERSRQMSGSLKTDTSPLMSDDAAVKTRDNIRTAHTRDISTAIANYSTDIGKYPATSPSGCVSRKIIPANFLLEIPEDPTGHVTKGCDGTDGTYVYRLIKLGKDTRFALQIELESPFGGNSSIDLDMILEGHDPLGVLDNLQKGSGPYLIISYE